MNDIAHVILPNRTRSFHSLSVIAAVLWACLLIALSLPAFAQAPVVSNVFAQQRPGTGLVDITYDVTSTTATVAINLRVSSDGGATFAVPVTSLTGAVGTGVAIGNGKRITWDAGSDWPEKWSDAMRFEISADDGIITPPTITTQPATQQITGGTSATLAVTVSGSIPITYQWYQGEVGTTTTPVGTNAASFTTPALTDTTDYWVRVSNSAGSVNSSGAAIFCSPTITTQPASQTITSGNTATLTVTALGPTPLTYQWYQGALGTTTTPVGINSASFTTPALTATTIYWVRVSNSVGSVNSTLATITCSPTITSQPASRTIASGSTQTLTVTASGSSSLSYQWYQGDVGTTTTPVGTDSASFTTPALSDETTYWVRVSNSAGSVNSTLATVTVAAELALIPAKRFQMGVTSGDTDSDAPSVLVTVSGFYMGRYEVTKALWDEVRTWADANGYTDLATGAGKAADHPVQTVSWWDVIKWCNARSEKEGLTPCYTVSGAVMKTGTAAPTVNWGANGYRLPTEAEWESAARGFGGKRFPWGTDTISHSQANYRSSTTYSYDSSGQVGNYHPTYNDGTTPYTSPVGSFFGTGWGLSDMAGNVSEWCWDWYGASTYVNNATDPRGPASGALRVFRGGSWDVHAYYCRAADRNGYGSTGQVNRIGFRIARSSVP